MARQLKLVAILAASVAGAESTDKSSIEYTTAAVATASPTKPPYESIAVGPAQYVSLAREGDSSWYVQGQIKGEGDSTWFEPFPGEVTPTTGASGVEEVPTAIAGVGPAEWVSIARDGDSSWYVHGTQPGSTWVVPANPAGSSAVEPKPTFPPLASSAVGPSPGEGTAIVGVEPGSTWVVPANPVESTAFPPLASSAVGPNFGAGTAIAGVGPAEWVSIARDGDSSWYVHYTVPGSTWVVPANPAESSAVGPSPTFPPLTSFAVGRNPGDGTAIVGVEPGSTWVVPANPIQSSGVVPANPTFPPVESSAVDTAKPTAAPIESSAVGPAQYVSLAREGDSSWYVAGVIKGEGDSTWFEAFPGEVTPSTAAIQQATGEAGKVELHFNRAVRMSGSLGHE